jgi:hypothetical protein
MGHFWPVLFFDFDFEGIDLSLAPPFREPSVGSGSFFGETSIQYADIVKVPIEGGHVARQHRLREFS